MAGPAFHVYTNAPVIEREFIGLAVEAVPAATVVTREAIKQLKTRVVMRLHQSGSGKQYPGLPNPSSAAPEPPAFQSGALANSWGMEVYSDPFGVIGELFSDSEYAARQDLGFVGRDSLGRDYSQQPRPFVEPSLDEVAPGWSLALLNAAVH